ncbi:hypothetical protein ACFLXA_06380 [Chloroflexota bacterium]
MGRFREDGAVDEGDYASASKEEDKMMCAMLAKIQPLCRRHTTAEEQADPLIF